MYIDRREFLKGLLALTSVTVLMGFDLSDPKEVDEAWETLVSSPFIFHVDQDGMLDDYSYDTPITHRDAYNIPTEITSMDDLLYCMEWQPFAWVIDNMYYYFVEELPESERPNWIREIDDGSSKKDLEAIEQWHDHLGKEVFISEMNNALQEWLNEEVNISEEEVYADVPLYGGTYVFNFFDSEPELMDQLDITLVEGFHPGDDSQHAMLGISVEEANKICISNDLPIRFERS